MSRFTTTGGIQRFKAGHHAARHKIAAMIGYLQEQTTSFWNKRVSEWIEDIVANGEAGWTRNDLLHLETDSDTIATLRSSHSRANNLPDIELRHLWLNMN
jgi:hypothetical protein